MIELSGDRIMVGGLSRLNVEPWSTNIEFFMTNHNGDSLWERSYNTDTTRTIGYCLIKTVDDLVILCGEEIIPIAPATSNVLLLKVDQDGLITNLAELKNQEKITISPNPNRGDFRVNLLDGDRELMIFDMTGRLILKQKINPIHGESFQVNNLKQGSYLIQIKSDKTCRTANVLVF